MWVNNLWLDSMRVNAPSPSTKTHKLFIKWLFSEWFLFLLFRLTFADFKRSDYNWITPNSMEVFIFWSVFGVLMCTWAFAIFVCYNLSHLVEKRNHLMRTHSVATFFGHAFDSINWNLMGNIKINYFVISKIMADERIWSVGQQEAHIHIKW